MEVVVQHPAEVLLGGSVRRPVVVREVEVEDAEVERTARDAAADLVGAVAAEVVPEAERDERELQAAAAAAAVLHVLVAIARGNVHGFDPNRR